MLIDGKGLGIRLKLDSSVGQVRVCIFPAFQQGETRTQTAFCYEGVPLEHRKRSWGVGKMCNRTCSALTQLVMVIERKKVSNHAAFQMQVSGQQRNLGSWRPPFSRDF